MSVILGDCLDVMAGMEPESVDAIVTDPPYGLEFMGKEWDSFQTYGPGGKNMKPRGPTVDTGSWTANYGWREKQPRCRRCGKLIGRGTGVCKCPSPDPDARKAEGGYQYQYWCERWAEAAYRVAKPSAYLLAFGGTRTVHRMTVALEDAGWIIRDMLVWAYASGFPKSKANLKPAWEPIVMARKPGPLRALAIDACRIGTTKDVPVSPGGKERPLYGDGWTGQPADSDALNPNIGRWPANLVLTDPIFDGGVEGVVGGGETSSPAPYTRRSDGDKMFGGGWDQWTPAENNYGDSGTYSRFFMLPKADRADREPILDEYAYRLHRERGECDKLSSWAGADLNLSEQTASTSPERDTSGAILQVIPTDSSSGTSSLGSPPTDPSPTVIRSTTSTGTSRTTDSTTSSSSIPSPTSDSIPAASSETASGGNRAPSAVSSSGSANPTGISPLRAGPSTADADRVTSGSSSSRSVCGRCGKPLPRVGTHPTVKPVDLMRHLVRLVTPTGGVVLDPFLGSGTTAIAAEMEGFPWIGIEREAEYVAIAEARLNGTQRGLGLETA